MTFVQRAFKPDGKPFQCPVSHKMHIDNCSTNICKVLCHFVILGHCWIIWKFIVSTETAGMETVQVE